MSKKTVKFALDSKSIDKAIQEVRDYEEWLKKKTKELLDKLGGKGYRVMELRFQHAEYDGTNDVKCDIREEGDNVVVLYAFGETVLFIEFGTGVKYPDDHPYQRVLPYGRGEYGKGKGKNPGGWRYVGEPGTHGVRSKAAKKKSIIHTYGNPANKCVYDTISQLIDEFEDIAREVFND